MAAWERALRREVVKVNFQRVSQRLLSVTRLHKFFIDNEHEFDPVTLQDAVELGKAPWYLCRCSLCLECERSSYCESTSSDLAADIVWCITCTVLHKTCDSLFESPSETSDWGTPVGSPVLPVLTRLYGVSRG